MKEKLDKVRHQIDIIDYKIIALLESRISLVQQVAQIKSANNELSYIKPNREAEMMRKLIKHSEKIPAQVVISMWRLIISFSLQHEKEFRANYYGQDKEKVTRLIREYFSTLTKVNNVEKLDDNFNDEDLLIFANKEKDMFEFLLKNQEYKIFANLPDIKEGHTYFKLSNILAAAKIKSETIAFDRAITAIPGLLGEDFEGELLSKKNKVKDVYYNIYDLSKTNYTKLMLSPKKQGNIALLGGYINKL